ncbi:MAG: hypothetical protein ACJASV_002769 [Pseudorhodobacter sp.]|jgi:hypothetical protein
MALFAAFAIITGLGLLAFARLAPSDPAVWHAEPDLVAVVGQGPWNSVVASSTGATLRLPSEKAASLLLQLDRLAMATPRTYRLAGNPEQGRITWITRSPLWGFPDYITAQVQPDGLYIYARLRFGLNDLGVNAARLNDWLTKL